MAREIDGKLRVASDGWGDFRFSLATGKVLGLTTRELYGDNPDINGTLEPVWNTGGNFPYPTSAQTVSIVSTSANDDVANVGVREVRVEYLDDNFVTNIVDVEMDGTNAVQVATDFYRLQTMRALSVGANGDAEGAITLAYGANTVATIATGTNESRGSQFTIPAGYTGYLVGAAISASKGGDLIFQFESRDASTANSPFIVGDELSIFESSMYFELPTFYVIPEKYDIRVRAKSLQASNVEGSVTYHLILRNNKDYANN